MFGLGHRVDCSHYSRAQAAEPAPDALPPQAALVFEDRFDKPELDPAWNVKAGQWKVVDGVFKAKGPDALAWADGWRGSADLVAIGLPTFVPGQRGRSRPYSRNT